MSLGRSFCGLGLVIGLWLPGAGLASGQVTVFAAASLLESLQDIATAFEKAGNPKVVFNFAGSSTLARQIEAGAPADIFFSADEAQMDRLQKQGLLVDGSRRDRLSNTLVIVVAAEHGAAVHRPEDLLKPGIRRVALGDPRAVPAGVYAQAYLASRGLWSGVAAKVVPTENVRGALAAVASGDAEAGIVYRTDALISKRVAIACAISANEGPPIRYPVALLRAAKDPVAARRFLEFLDRPLAEHAFEQRGFLMVP